MSAVFDSLAFVFVVSVVLVIMIELIKGLFRNGVERQLDALLRVEAKIDLLLEQQESNSILTSASLRR